MKILESLNIHTHCLSLFRLCSIYVLSPPFKRLPRQRWSMLAKNKSHTNIESNSRIIASIPSCSWFHLPTVSPATALCGQGQESAVGLPCQAAPCPVSSPTEGDWHSWEKRSTWQPEYNYSFFKFGRRSMELQILSNCEAKEWKWNHNSDVNDGF